MRVALLSDIHANLPALEAVLADVERHDIHAVWVLGDIVGYGADPNEVVAALRAAEAIAVVGNHDAVAVGRIGAEAFNPLAAQAARWTASVLSDEARSWCRSLPEVRQEHGVTLCHGTLRGPIWKYLLSAEAAQAHFALQPTPWSVVGHTHVPLVATMRDGRVELRRPEPNRPIPLPPGVQVCLNPGAVGQPRDGDPRAAYAILDLGAKVFELKRVPYPIAEAQRRIRTAGLPEPLALRLAIGR